MALFDDRDNLLKYLIENNIEAKIHYPIPLHLQKAAKKLNYKVGSFPLAEQQAKFNNFTCSSILKLQTYELYNKKINSFYA